MNIFQICEEFKMAIMMEAPDEIQNFLEKNMRDQLDNIARTVKEFDARADALRAERLNLHDRERTQRNYAANARKNIIMIMQQLGEKKVIGKTEEITLVPNGGKRSIIIEDETQIGSEWRTEPPKLGKIDKERLYFAIERGQDVPEGVYVADQGYHIRIK